MRSHANQSRCFDLITETTRLRMAIEEQEAREGLVARLTEARLWLRFHRAMVELLALTPAHDREAERRQARTIHGHRMQAFAWAKAVEQLEEQAALEREA